MWIELTEEDYSALEGIPSLRNWKFIYANRVGFRMSNEPDATIAFAIISWRNYSEIHDLIKSKYPEALI